MIMSNNPEIDTDNMPEEIRNPGEKENWYEEDNFSIKKMSRAMEARLIKKALNRVHGNKTRASKLLEISYPALLSKISEYGIIPNGYNKPDTEDK
jgi:transcriptional regulator with PAS, ATPase and Fis domain